MEWKLGYRFNPTDVELVDFYLKGKILGDDAAVKKAINELPIYQHEPWDLPNHAKMPSRHRMWHFFTQLNNKRDKKGIKTKRTTEAGYWKATGRDREIKLKRQKIGTKKTLVFHQGRMPKGKRTDWIMHEYHLSSDSENQKHYVVCKVKNKKRKNENVKPRDGGEASSDITLEISDPIQTTAQSSIDYNGLDYESLSWNDILHRINSPCTQFSKPSCWVNSAMEDQEFLKGLEFMNPDIVANLFAD